MTTLLRSAFARVVALLLVAGPLGAATPAPERFPLDHYLTNLAEQQWSARATQMAAIKTPAEAQARGSYIRAEFLKAIGGLPDQRGTLNARVTGRFERKGYRVENIIYESLPGCFVTANLYIPTTGPGPFPAVLGAAGHATVEGKANDAYQKAWILMAQNGHVVLAYDPPAQGERFELLDPKTGVVTSGSHISPGLQCLLTGKTSTRYFLWDGIRGFDYLLTRPEVDPKRIAASGNSGGGTQSAFLAVVEPRLAAAAPSCYWTSWPALWSPAGPQDSEQVLPGFIKAGLDFSDLAIAFAPKPIIMLTATRDMFPVQGARDMHAEAKRVFGLLGAAPQAGYFEYDDGHGWSQPRREAATAWFNQWFYGRKEPVKEPAIEAEKLETLRATVTGHVLTSLPQPKTLQKLNQDVAEALYPKRTLSGVTDAGKARATITARLAVPAAAPASARSLWRTLGADYSIETLAIASEPGVEVRTEVFVPTARPGPAKPAVIIARDDASPIDPETDAEVAAWRKAGYVVLIAQLRGLQNAPEKKAYYTTNYRTSMRAVLLGKTLAGMRTRDLLAVFDYASTRPEIAAGKITIVGRGNMGAIAQYAAALEPKISKVIASETLVSYMDVVRAPRCPENFVDIIVPSVLVDFDLPDVAGAAGPGRIVLVNPVSAAGGITTAAAQTLYGAGVKVLASAGPITPELVK
ncbi:MAG: hypothetical protein RIQ93_640 [Verrucomicrobiota bacterium]|jgi:cephalosporin-C deacetylase-like acetyl esterase